MVTEIFVIVLLLVLLLFLMIIMTGKNGSDRRSEVTIISPEEEQLPPSSGSKCPLCGAYLPRGEKVHSHLYSGKPDGIMHIFGCPHCYIDHPRGEGETEYDRICPCCHETLKVEDYLIARVFEKSNRKTQVHVLGCTICRGKRN